MRVVALSDTHWCFKDVEVPKCDLLLHAGDLQVANWEQAKDFSEWWNSLDAKIKVLTPGNHDLLMEYQDIGNYFDNTIVLINQTAILKNGLVIAGTPYTPIFNDWAFMEYDSKLDRKMSCIGNDVDIVLSHGPMYGIHDGVNVHRSRPELGQEHVGSKTLKNIIDKLDSKKRRYLFHGHIHGYKDSIKYTSIHKDTTTVDVYNVSICDEDYEPVNEPRVLEI